ncbi:hypothetical protein BJY01DRAFT_263715 [Aspergillus pseudoustus]|uniref:Uncharacterized protein n=1 Tax=Aspergillus pseudoustus TaxID=1810923 RepID=A0ABR4JZ14_9EURO
MPVRRRSSAPPPRFDAKPKTVGPPRLDPYHRLLSRFYEPLVLLQLLGKSGGNPTPRPLGLDAAQATRRMFLQNLSFICDYNRGGETCTAIALESTETCYRFWAASYKGKEKIPQFLKVALDFLRDIDCSSETELANKTADFSRRCIEFATKRIDKEKRCLFAAIHCCRKTLSDQNTTSAEDLSEWLESLLSYNDNFRLCMFAYESRHSHYLSHLQMEAAEQEKMMGPNNCFESFASARHLLGRLAHHIRASRELVENANSVSYILQAFEVCFIDPMQCVPPPASDAHTHVNGFLNRLLGKDCNERVEIEDGLWKLNDLQGVFVRFPTEYQRLKPRIHAEVQVLEYFYANKMEFAGNDRYIACSKPACLCCEMYFKYHPARMVVPESHRNIWVNWGPPNVENYSKATPAGRHQLDILNPMIKEIRELIIRKALERSTAGHWHPDSKTGITNLHCTRESPIDRQYRRSENPLSSDSAGSGESIADEDSDHDNGGVAIYT